VPVASDGRDPAIRLDQNAWFSAGHMTVPRSDATVARVGGKIYLFGGCNSPALGATQFYDSVEIYDPRTATSTLLLSAVLPGGPRANLAAGDPQNGSSANASHRIHITGGWSSAGTPPPDQNHAIFDVDQLRFLNGTAMPNHCPPDASVVQSPNQNRSLIRHHDPNRSEHELLNGKDRIFAVGGACPIEGTAQSNVDMQKLSGDPPVQSASITASSCNATTFPVCLPQPLGTSAVFVTGSGFASLSAVQLTSSLQGILPPALTDVQGEFTSIYVDLACAGQARLITATDAAGNSG
jgi:Kelch motif